MLGPAFATWVEALITLSVLSFLYKENAAWRAVEHMYIGFAGAHAICMGYANVVNLAWRPLTAEGRYYLLIPCTLGIMLYGRFVPRQRWVSRYPMAFLVGTGTGMILKGIIAAQFVAQVKATMVPLNSFGNLVMVFGTVAVLFYFYFSAEEKRPVEKRFRTFGRWIMMIAFGATFGNAVMGEMTLLIGRLQFLYGKWLHLVE